MDSILLFIHDKEILSLLTEYLSGSYNLFSAGSIDNLSQNYDLYIIDIPALEKSKHQIQLIKKFSDPVLLPVLLITSSEELQSIKQQIFDIDELLLSPVQKIELQTRVGMLLKARKFSLQKNKHESHDCLQFVAKSVNIGLWDWNLKVNKIFFTDEWKNIMGFSDQEISDEFPKLANIVHPDDFTAAVAKIRKLISERIINHKIEFRLHSHDNNYRWMLSQGTLYFDKQGNPEKIIGAHIDITAQKGIQNKLQISLSELQKSKNDALDSKNQIIRLLDRVSDGFIALDKNWICTYINSAAKRMFKQDLIGKPVFNIYAEENNNDQSSLKRLVQNNQNCIVEVYSKSLNRWFENRIYSCPEGTSLFITDITESKHARQEIENKNYLLTEAERLAHLGSWDLDCVTFRIFWSDEMYRINGVTRDNFNLTIDNLIELTCPDDRDTLLDWINLTIAGKHPPELEIKVIRPDGAIRYVRGLGKIAKFDDKGNPVRIIGITQDITEKKLADEKIAYKSYLMSESQRLGHLGTWELDIKSGIEYWSEELYRVTELSSETFEPNLDAVFNLIHQNDMDSVRKWADKLTSTISKSELTYRLVLKSGKIKWINSVAESFGDEAGKPVKIIGFSQDITERKKASDTIQLNEKRWRRFLEGFKGITYQIESETSKVIMLFGQIEAISGYSQQSLFSNEITWDQLVYPEDRNSYLEENSRLNNKQTNISVLDYRINHKDGKTHWLRDIAWAENINSKTIINGVVFDITNQKNLEIHFQKLNRVYAVLSHINEIIVRTRNQNKILHSACQIAVEYGRFRKALIALVDSKQRFDIVAHCELPGEKQLELVMKETSILSEPFYEKIHSNLPFIDNDFDPQNYSTQLLKSIALDCKSFSCFPIMVKGELMYVLFLCAKDSNFFDESETKLLEELCYDIGYAIEFIQTELQRLAIDGKLKNNMKELARKNSELSKLNYELNKANAELRQFDRAKTDFVSVASHEIRTPLASILGFVQTILAPDIELPKEDHDKYLHVIESEAVRLSKLVDEILDISKIETGRLELKIENFSIISLVENVIQTIIIPSTIGVNIVIKDKGDYIIKGDRERLGQVIRNIIENAVRFSNPDSEITINISKAENEFIVAVQDTGPGIAPAERNKIFEKFYRVKGEKNKSRGSGLGLAIAKEIISAHGGKIWVESEPGKGATFFFTVPS